jgi:hypothetical protein
VLIVLSNVFNNLVVLSRINQILIRQHLLFNQNSFEIVLKKKSDFFCSAELITIQKKKNLTIILDYFIEKQNVIFLK